MSNLLSRLPKKGDGVQKEAMLLQGTVQAIPSRALEEDTCAIYGYRVGTYHGQPCHIADYLNEKGEVVSQHIRTPTQKGAWVRRQEKLQLFGSHVGSQGILVLTEGQIDALSVFQALASSGGGNVRGQKPTTVCSITDGVGGGIKSIEQNIGYCSRFEEVIVFFDQDEPGRAATLKAAALLGPRTRVVSRFPFKDANEALVAGDVQAIRIAIRDAQPYRPDHVITAGSLLEAILHPVNRMGLLFPWAGWNGEVGGHTPRTMGMRPGQLWNITGGTGLGKSAFVRSIALSLALQGTKVAFIPLEQTVEETVELMLNEAMGTRLDAMFQAERDAAAEDITNTLATFQENLLLVNEFGGEEFDDFVSTVRHLVLSEGCEVICLDHFSMLADGINLAKDQRRAIDQCMKRLKTLAVELQFTLVMLSHLSRVDGKPHEEGGRPTLADLRGSHSLAQVPDFIVALQRNPHSTEGDANVTTCWLLKNRPFGKVGELCKIAYDSDTSRLVELTPFPSLQ